jgi:hypothetical protein
LQGPQTVLPAFGKTGSFCTGVQKLLQRYAVILLTNVGSQPNFKTFGTEFLYTLNAGISPVDKLAARIVFMLANHTAVLALRAYQINHPEIPADERIITAKLDDITLYAGFAGFDVSVATEAGDIIDFVVPLPKK